MATTDPFQLAGSCSCKALRYRMETRPIIVNCCHCTYCQRETGSAFALNAVIESDRITTLSSISPETIHTPSFSGKGQDISRCPICHIAVWSNYPGSGPFLRYVRVGTLDRKDGEGLRPDVHIYTGTKMEWVDLSKEEERGATVVEEHYDREVVWGKESLERWRIVQKSVEHWKRTGLVVKR